MQALPASRSVLLILHSNRAAISTPWQFEKLAAHAHIEYAGDRSGDSATGFAFLLCLSMVNSTKSEGRTCCFIELYISCALLAYPDLPSRTFTPAPLMMEPALHNMMYRSKLLDIAKC